MGKDIFRMYGAAAALDAQAIKQARAVGELSIRTEVAHASDIMEGNGPIRPAGVRHEIVLDTDPAFVLVREVWFWSDNGEIRHADERRVGINDLVHIVVNMTDAERRFFAETRTTWPETDWEGVPRPAQNLKIESSVDASTDPAKLAAMMADVLREGGASVWVDGTNQTVPPKRDQFVFFPYQDAIQVHPPTTEEVERSKLFTLPEARALLLQWLKEPNDVCKQARLVLCGNHADPDELLHTIPVREYPEPRRFDADPDRERE